MILEQFRLWGCFRFSLFTDFLIKNETFFNFFKIFMSFFVHFVIYKFFSGLRKAVSGWRSKY